MGPHLTHQIFRSSTVKIICTIFWIKFDLFFNNFLLSLKTNINIKKLKDHWPPNSPDLNPLDYFYWNAVVAKMNQCLFNSRAEFVANIEKACLEVDQSEITKSVNSFTKRVRKIEDNEGKYIKK